MEEQQRSKLTYQTTEKVHKTKEAYNKDKEDKEDKEHKEVPVLYRRTLTCFTVSGTPKLNFLFENCNLCSMCNNAST